MTTFHDYMKDHKHNAIFHPVLGPIVMIDRKEFESIQREAFEEGTCGEPVSSKPKRKGAK